MIFVEEHNEVKPKLAEAVMKVWEDAGTYITSVHLEPSTKELEYFVERLVERIADDLTCSGFVGVYEALARLGYCNDR